MMVNPQGTANAFSWTSNGTYQLGQIISHSTPESGNLYKVSSGTYEIVIDVVN